MMMYGLHSRPSTAGPATGTLFHFVFHSTAYSGVVGSVAAACWQALSDMGVGLRAISRLAGGATGTGLPARGSTGHGWSSNISATSTVSQLLLHAAAAGLAVPRVRFRREHASTLKGVEVW
jgi:hypothetical protein